MHPFLNIADQAARSAGQIIIRALDRLDRLQIHEKHHNDFVTEIDQKVEKLLIEKIQEAYPSHGILAEETGEYPGKDDYTWIIDPLDGTTNFIHGLPGFAISIGIRHKRRMEQALIYDPSRHESFYATRGEGARLNQHRLRVSTCSQLKKALIYINYPPGQGEGLNQKPKQSVYPLIAGVGGVRHLGSAALGLAYVAAGRLDGMWSFGLKPWDMAAGALMVQEAGGIVCDHQGGDRYMETGNIIAANPRVCRSLLQTAAQINISLESD